MVISISQKQKHIADSKIDKGPTVSSLRTHDASIPAIGASIHWGEQSMVDWSELER